MAKSNGHHRRPSPKKIRSQQRSSNEQKNINWEFIRKQRREQEEQHRKEEDKQDQEEE